MLKTFDQQRIEAEHNGKPIKDILVVEFENLKGQKLMIPTISVQMKISSPTLRKWCVDLGIEIKDYQ